ncbi:AraC family transcriptional regulator [Pseudoxanthomonas winnipegensis]|uniref:AraC family transcriptional regulator n=1 Tax=Pseudoxanthomonas winnipegensis TaxID=2480810 RepID=A0A4Q8LZR1_9GAMM|nr:AraC family transcriptional regulator [Pseudoxanthomonas winnipegensis]RZZ90348.1 AraC family transcriptional regulator [Pseudoxanthomonas winnipegensis]TAA37495.1 AraC family transcriptional regulator [Pseudoxanthomonas winnipegensis]
MHAATSEMRKVPPWLSHTVSARASWSWCAMEQSCFGPVQLDAPALPFHHLSLPLDRGALRMGMCVDGRRHVARMGQDDIGIIAAGDGGRFWWDRPVDSACLYFTDAALGEIVGHEVTDRSHGLRSTLQLRAPAIAGLLRVLRTDAATGQPHGALVGDAVFVALIPQLMPMARVPSGPRAADWRVGRALAYIHAHLSEPLDLASIAQAAASSPFHLARAFRARMGCTLWRYVLRERARGACWRLRDERLSLAAVAQAAGFVSYAGFIAAMRHEFGQSPQQLRQALSAGKHPTKNAPD